MTAVLTSGAHAKRAGSSAISFAAHRRELGTIAVSIPFFAYTACFLLAPTIIVIVGAFQSADGSFTVANFNKLFEANTIAAFGTSILVSVASAVIGAIEWVATLPLTIPAIVLVVGLGPIYRWLSADVLSTNPIWLCFAYVVLVMPFAFRALAVGLNSIDVKTLCEASRSLGASWPRVFFRVLIPNLWQSILSASFISIAVVLGEYTVASLLGRMNLQVALYQLGQSNSQISTAMSLLALLFGVILLVALDLISGAMRRNKEGDNS